MRRHLFGSTGQRVPVIGQGTGNIELGDHAAAIEAFRRGVYFGMSHIDTAEMYGAGEAEQLVGAECAELVGAQRGDGNRSPAWRAPARSLARTRCDPRRGNGRRWRSPVAVAVAPVAA